MKLITLKMYVKNDKTVKSIAEQLMDDTTSVFADGKNCFVDPIIIEDVATESLETIETRLKDPSESIFLMRSTTNPNCFWSSTYGWTSSLQQATRYTLEQKMSSDYDQAGSTWAQLSTINKARQVATK